MKKNILIFILTTLLLASVLIQIKSQPPQPVQSLGLIAPNQSTELVAFGTLADSSDPLDMAASVVYTQLAMVRYDALKRLNANQLTVHGARAIQEFADTVRTDLDFAVRRKNMVGIQNAANQLKQWKSSQ